MVLADALPVQYRKVVIFLRERFQGLVGTCGPRVSIREPVNAAPLQPGYEERREELLREQLVPRNPDYAGW